MRSDNPPAWETTVRLFRDDDSAGPSVCDDGIGFRALAWIIRHKFLCFLAFIDCRACPGPRRFPQGGLDPRCRNHGDVDSSFGWPTE